MGSLRNSLFVDAEGKTRPTNTTNVNPRHMSDHDSFHGGTSSRWKKSTMTSNSDPIGNTQPAVTKRKSFGSILRSWRRDDTPPAPPIPRHLVANPNRSACTKSYVAPSHANRDFSSQGASGVRFPGPGVCSTRPSGMYNGGNAGSTLSLAERRPLTISAPIPGVGDVPAHYQFRGEPSVSTVTEAPDSETDDPPPAIQARLSQGHKRTPSQSSTAAAPPRPHRPVGLGIDNASLPNLLPSRVPRAPPRPQHRTSVRPTNGRDTEFNADTEVAALLTDAHIPPSEASSAPQSKSSTPENVSPSPSNIPVPTRQSVVQGQRGTGNISMPIAEEKQSELNSVALCGSGPGVQNGSRERSVSFGRPSPLFSNVSWAAVAPSTTAKQRSTMIPTRVPQVDTSAAYGSQKVEALVESPVAETVVSKPKAQSSPYSTGGSLPSDPIPITRPLSVRPRSIYSTTFGDTHSAGSSYSSITDYALSHSMVERSYTPNDIREPITNVHLQTNLQHAKSEVSLRAPRLSINRVSTGAVGNGPLSAPGNSRMSYHLSQVTVRDERRDHDTSPDSRPGSRSSMISTGPAPGGQYSVPALLAEIESLKANGARLQAELVAARSQVNLLYPPTPAELAEQEALEALEDLETRASSSASGTPGTSSRPRSASRNSMTGSPRLDESDSTASTPSSSTSEIWPVTPIMHGDWSPTAGDSSLGSSVSSYRKIALGSNPTFDSRYYSPSGTSKSRIPRLSGVAPQRLSELSGAPPPRPPRAARRSDLPTLPPGAADAVTPGANLHSRPHTLFSVSGLN